METTRVVVYFLVAHLEDGLEDYREQVKLDHLLKDFGLSTEVSQGS